MNDRKWFIIRVNGHPKPIHITEDFAERLSKRFAIEEVKDGRFLDTARRLHKELREGQLEALCSITDEIPRDRLGVRALPEAPFG